jgi:hypothetical protein
MGKYGQVASKAANLLISKKLSNPSDAWDISAKQIFPNSESSRNKGYPRSTFLGLCEDGYIKSVEAGNYTRSKKNKAYALSALTLIEENLALLMNEKELWTLVVNHSDKKYNSQMDVVISLWIDGVIAKY